MKKVFYLLILVQANIGWAQTTTVGHNVGDMAPAFQLTDADNNDHQLSTYQSKIILLDFWASWCGPCIKSFPLMHQLYAKHGKNPNFEIISISIDFNSSQWLKALNKHQPNWINLRTNRENYPEVREAYDVLTVPKLYLIDKDGKIVAKNIGIREAEKYIDKLLSNSN